MDKSKTCALGLFLFFAAFYSLFSIGHFGGDGYGDYLVAESIVLHGTVALHEKPADEDVLAYHAKVGVVGRDGETYSSRPGLGMPFILVIPYALGHLISMFLKNIPHDFITMFFVSFTNPILSALNCLLFFIIAQRLFFSTRTGVALSCIYGLATMAPVYARTGFSEPAVILFLLLAIYFILRYAQSGRFLFMIVSALALSYMAYIKPNTLIFFPCFIVYLCWVLMDTAVAMNKKIKTIALFGIFLVIPLVLLFTYNWYIYGSFSKFGGQEAFGAGKRIAESPHFLKGIYYYLLSTGKGLFIFNVPLLVSLAGIRSVPRKRRKEAILFMLIFIVNLLFFVKSFHRGSLFSWGPRYLMPCVAVSIFFVGYFLEKHKNFSAKLFVVSTSIAGFLVMLPCMFLNQSKFYFFVVEQLHLSEYMINFIPDLSPILGAWKMFIARIIFIVSGIDTPFVYNPDYRLIPAIDASLLQYNNFDFWFLKILHYAPHYKNYIFILMGTLLACSIISLYGVVKNMRSESH